MPIKPWGLRQIRTPSNRSLRTRLVRPVRTEPSGSRHPGPSQESSVPHTYYCFGMLSNDYLLIRRPRAEPFDRNRSAAERGHKGMAGSLDRHSIATPGAIEEKQIPSPRGGG